MEGNDNHFADRHFEIDRQRILDVQDHVRWDDLLESGLFHDVVGSRRQIRQRVFPGAIASQRGEVDGPLRVSGFPAWLLWLVVIRHLQTRYPALARLEQIRYLAAPASVLRSPAGWVRNQCVGG